jgi:outer membrane protein OmpA-like peptidoglycan-associated protein
MTKTPVVCIALAALALAACTEPQSQLGTENAFTQLNNTTPTGSPFTRSLFQQYAQLSKSEYNQGDFKDSDAYKARAMAAAQGTAPAPESVTSRNLPADKVGEISGYRDRLVKALDNGSRDRVPSDAARAQTMFDCWLEQQEENRQPNDIAACRNGFLASLDLIERVPPASRKTESFTLYFDKNKATPTTDSRRELQRVISQARQNRYKEIRIEGYTDRTGSDAYNLKLSQRREAYVHEQLHKAGINANIDTNAYGETKAAINTADGVAEPKNRRVVVTLTE